MSTNRDSIYEDNKPLISYDEHLFTASNAYQTAICAEQQPQQSLDDDSHSVRFDIDDPAVSPEFKTDDSNSNSDRDNKNQRHSRREKEERKNKRQSMKPFASFFKFLDYVDASHRTISSITCYDYNKKSMKTHILRPYDLSKLEKPEWAAVRWVHVEGISSEFLQLLRSKHDIHLLDLNDIATYPQPNKVSVYNNYIFIIATLTAEANYDDIRSLYVHDKRERLLRTEQVSFLLFRDMLITIKQQGGSGSGGTGTCSSPKTSYYDVWHDIRDDLASDESYLRDNDASFLMYALLDTIISNCFPIATAFGEALQDYEFDMMDNATSSLYKKVYSCRRELMWLRRHLTSLKAVISKLTGSSVNQYYGGGGTVFGGYSEHRYSSYNERRRSITPTIPPPMVLQQQQQQQQLHQQILLQQQLLQQQQQQQAAVVADSSSYQNPDTFDPNNNNNNNATATTPPQQASSYASSPLLAGVGVGALPTPRPHLLRPGKRDTYHVQQQETQARKVLISDNARLYLMDLEQDMNSSLEIIDTNLDLASSMLQWYSDRQGAKINKVMYVMGVISTVFIPLTFIAGLYGMNFDIMPELHWEYGYVYVLLLMLGIAVLEVVFFVLWTRGSLRCFSQLPRLLCSGCCCCCCWGGSGRSGSGRGGEIMRKRRASSASLSSSAASVAAAAAARRRAAMHDNDNEPIWV